MGGKKNGMLRIAEQPERRSPWLITVSLLLAAALLALALRGVRWQETRDAIRGCRPDMLLVAALALSLSYIARGMRWRLLIVARAPLSSLAAFWTTMIGYLANNVFPGRPGDVIRPILTSRVARTSVSYALAAVIVERFGDILTLVAMSVVASLSLAAAPAWLRGATRGFALVGVAGVVALFTVALTERRLTGLAARLPLPGVLRSRVGSVVREFLLGVRAVRPPSRALHFAWLTLAIWLLDIGTGMAIAWATRLPIGWTEMTLLLVALSLASALPSTPGNIGVFPFVAVSVLVPFGLTRGYALAYILVFQVVTYLVESAWGGIGLWRLGGRFARPPMASTVSVGGEQRHSPGADARATSAAS